MNPALIGVLFVFLAATHAAVAPPPPTVYAVVWGHPAYVVGSSTLHSGLYRSTDLGRSWVHLGPENLKAFSMDFVDSSRGRVLYIAAGNGVHRSLDSGRTWKILTDWRMTEVLGIAVNQSTPDRLYAGTAFGFWSSSDGGATWVRPEGELQNRYVTSIRWAGGGTLEAVAESRYDEDMHASFLSADHGQTWRRTHSLEAVRYHRLDSAVVALDVAGVGGVVLAATWGGGVRRLDGTAWVPSGLDGSQVWDLVVDEP